VVFTSGIVDEGLPLAAVTSQYYPVGPLWAGSRLALVVGWWVWNLGLWLVGVGLAHCWALRHQARKRGNLSRDRRCVPLLVGACWGCWWGLSLGFEVLVVALLCLSLACWWGLGVGGVVV